MSGPLSGVKVIDLSTVIFGPYAAQIMGDLGAEVIKIEGPNGDSTRQLGPKHHPGMAAVFMNLNRNKRGVMLDLAKPRGRDVLLRLVRDADVLIHNLRPKPVAKLKIDYAALAAVNPRLIYCTGVGYGSGGPYKDKPAYDDLIQGGGGFATIIGQYLGGAPRYVPSAVADKISGLTALYAILAALYSRTQTGRGQAIEAPMFEAVTSFIMTEHLYGSAFEPAIGPTGYTRVMSKYRSPYATKDGYVCAVPYTDKHWRDFFTEAGRPDLANNPAWSSLAKRNEDIGTLYEHVSIIMKTRTTAEWIALFTRLDIPVQAVNSLDDLITDPHLAAVGFWSEYDHPTEGRVRNIGIPTRFSETPGDVRRHTPRLGEHTVEVMREAGYSDAEIAAIIAEGAAGDGSKKNLFGG
jgi:crotonobetainyl-CoA:carnitine CoA-transferase CaiB-like acyl-CoA transferase